MTAAFVTLLKRSDVDLFMMHQGTDWLERAARLGDGHCFDVLPLLIAPNVPADALQQALKALEPVGVGAGWFACDPAVALGSLAATVFDPLCVSSGPLCMAAKVPATEVPAAQQPAASPAPALPEATVDAGNEEEEEDFSDALAGTECEGCEGETQELLQWLEPCAATEASKAADVRASLTAVLGKAEAKRLLAGAQTTVARTGSGQKNRIFRINGQPVKLCGNHA